MKLAMIPARGGSKRIPRKNIKFFHGQPIIAYSIHAALQSAEVDRVIVSTDDEEIATGARTYGAEAPFIRPTALSDDHATTLDVIRHALEWASAENQVDALLCLYATAPFVTADDISKAYRIFEHQHAQYVFAATDYAFPVHRAFTLVDNKISLLFPEHQSTRSQDLPDVSHDAGQFYWCRPEAAMANTGIFSGISFPYMIDRCRAQDIDTAEDWAIAEALYSIKKNGS
jgi:N-acylneuraminate cytidylyltransferase